MAKALITAEERSALPEPLQAEYPEPIADEQSPHNGLYLLKVTGVDGYELEDVKGLKATVSARATDIDKLKAENGRLKSDVEAKTERVTELEAIDPDKEADRLAEERTKSTTEQMKRKHAEDLETKDKQILKLQGGLQNALIKSEAIAAITAQKGSVPLLLNSLVAECQLKERTNAEGETEYYAVVLDEAKNPRIADAQGRQMTIAERVVEMKADKDFAPAFGGTEAKGGGRPSEQGVTKPVQQPGEKSSVQKIQDGLAKMRTEAA